MATEAAKLPKTGAVQDSWRQPTRAAGHEDPTIKVYNSLTRTKVDFVTKKPGVVTWYNCGPTVYDASHMGHARNYMTQDIMRRILRDYFGYEVHFVMNITDVDDKIIIRGRQSHLLNNYLTTINSTSSPLSSELISEVKAIWAAHFFKSLGASLPTPSPSDTFQDAVTALNTLSSRSIDSEWVKAQSLINEKFTMYMAAVKTGLEGINNAGAALKEGRTGAAEATALIQANADSISASLDKKHGATVTDPTIFRNLASKWEQSFFDSMQGLHVERPTTLTRVSEYIPEIVTFVEEIVKRGLAYSAGGSVWFDTAKFDGAEGEMKEDGDDGWKHTYAKLQPWSKGNRELLEDGEGSLSDSSGQRMASDFALWKSSKPGEPAWPSPWGPGRPGWHIECSVMASAVLGPQMDVHSGGVDLAFPHHDNEIAQSEAYHGCRQWVAYFLHTGHLHIEGLKMSKSLKNFITIDDALTRYSARRLRFAFLNQPWSSKFDFKDSGMTEVAGYETTLNNFFASTNALVSEHKVNIVASDGQHHYEQAERDLLAELERAQLSFRLALCDSFDTPEALRIILDLVSSTNKYVKRGRNTVNVEALWAVSEWVTRMLRMFGLGEGSATDGLGERVIGWGQEGSSEGGADRSTVLMPYLRAMSTFRDEVRKLAMNGGTAAEILVLSDRLRDVGMVDLGVALDDQEDGKALVKLVPAEILRSQRAEKEAIAAEKASKKAATQAAAEQKRLEKLAKGKLAPSEMFKDEKLGFLEWDEAGLPTKEKGPIVDGQDGGVVDVAKSKRKKLQKEFDQQTKLHEEYKKSL